MPNLDTNEVAAFVRKKMDKAVLELEPFPHVSVPNVFPDDYYDALLAHWPDISEFVELGSNIVLGLFFRPMPGRMEGLEQMKERGLFWPARVKTFAFWKQFQAIVDQQIIPALAAKLSPAIVAMMRPGGAQIHPEMKAQDFEVSEDLLIVRRNGHTLSPHIDDLRSLIQLLIYFPEDNTRPYLGTRYFQQVGPGRARVPREMENPRFAQYADSLGIQVVEVKRIPFRRNTLVANLNAPRSWHGQKLEEVYDRKGYQAFLGVRPELLRLFFDDESAAILAGHPG